MHVRKFLFDCLIVVDSDCLCTVIGVQKVYPSFCTPTAGGEEEDDDYMPPSEDEASLGDDEFVVPEDPVEQERLERRLMATARSLKKKQQ